MSDPHSPLTSTPLPPASVDITEMRRAVDAVGAESDGRQPVRTTVLGTIGLMIAVAAVVALTAAADLRSAVALGGTALLLGVAVVFVLPVQLARRRARATLDRVAVAVDDAVERLIRHLASIGYALPDDVALDWVTSPDPTATVPLVHDSVIAARWWRPAERDDRVFVEAILRQGGRDAALPVLPPLPREPDDG